MISIHKLEFPENATILERYPKLGHIWEMAAMQERALNSYMNWDPRQKTGEIFLVKNDDQVVGVTGWWVDDQVLDTARLRWHGIIPEERGKGYSEESIKLLMMHLDSVLPAHYVFVSETLSLGRVSAEKVRLHFEKMGFAEFDDPTYGDNGYGKTVSLRMCIPGR